MATDTFLKVGDIKGESTDAQHRDELELQSWAWGVSQTGGAGHTGGASGKPSFPDLIVTHAVDRASPRLMRACAAGEHIKEATLTARKAGSPPKEFLVIRMMDVVVTSVHPSASPGGLIETVSLQCDRVDYEYRAQKPDGTLDAGVHFGYDIEGNKPL